jgi:hypothetical protein
LTGAKQPLLRYLAMVGAVGAAASAVALMLPPGARRLGLLVATGVAAGVQVPAFIGFLRFRSRPHGFLAAWVGGTLLRLGALGGTGVVVWRREELDPLWTLLGLAGLFFVLHLLELAALRGVDPEPETGIESG